MPLVFIVFNQFNDCTLCAVKGDHKGHASVLINTGKCPLGLELREPVEGRRVLSQEAVSPASSFPSRCRGRGRGDQGQAGLLGLGLGQWCQAVALD